MSEYGAEIVDFFEIDQPRCGRTYGDGASLLQAEGADFDGAADWLTRGADLSGNADSKRGLLSVWVRFDGSADQFVYANEVGRCNLSLASGRITINNRNATDAHAASFRSSGTYSSGSTWRHILAAWDAALGIGQLYVDGVDVFESVGFSNTDIDYTSSNWAVGAGNAAGAVKLNACLAELYLAPGQYLDISDESNRLKFRTASGHPANLGADGSVPTGAAPLIYLGIEDGGAASDFAVNSGTGGNFTITGALALASTSPTDGQAGCTAALGDTGQHKCFNTKATCQDAANYDPSETVVIRFARKQAGILQYGPLIPSLDSVSPTPGAVNLGGMDRNAAALGQREMISVRLDDHLHSDHRLDKYRLERYTGEALASPSDAYDPYLRGTFWGKWLARNPFYRAYSARWRRGIMGEDLEDMHVRHYLLDVIEGPSEGQVTLVAKDFFSRIDPRKAVAPPASNGSLQAGISAVAGSATLSPAGIGNEEYEASGYLAIGGELVAFTRSADTLTLTERGALGTTAAAHSAEDLVQQVLSLEGLGRDIAYTLLTGYASIEAAWIDQDEWNARGVAAGLVRQYEAHICKPTPVETLVGELAEQDGFTIFPNPGTGMIEFVPLSSQPGAVRVTDAAWILDGSFSRSEQTSKRASQIWVYYGIRNPLESVDETSNYHSRVVTPDLASEEDHGSPAVRNVFSRWISQFGNAAAEEIGARLIAMFRDPPIEVTFRVDAARRDSFSPAGAFLLETAEIQDELGDAASMAMAVTAIEHGDTEVEIRAQELTFGDFTVGGERLIIIPSDIANINLREIHDSQYSAPVGGSNGEIIRFVLAAGVSVYSESTALRALRTGEWPLGVTLYLDVTMGRVQGAAGKGGAGGENGGAGAAGGAGGDAIWAEHEITIIVEDSNGVGEVWAGAGGGGGGGSGGSSSPFVLSVGGGGGGGGAGNLPGARGAGGQASFPSLPDGDNGTAGTAEARGLGGAGHLGTGSTGTAGNGGNGGNPGLAGNSGSAATGGDINGAGGAGGARGNYIVGDSLVTWIGTGDRRGGVVA